MRKGTILVVLFLGGGVWFSPTNGIVAREGDFEWGSNEISDGGEQESEIEAREGGFGIAREGVFEGGVKSFVGSGDEISDGGMNESGFKSVFEGDIKKVTGNFGSGDYSGIAYLGGTRFAVVDDKRNGGGILFADIDIDMSGKVRGVSMMVPEGTLAQEVVGMDNEGVAYCPDYGAGSGSGYSSWTGGGSGYDSDLSIGMMNGRGMLFVSAERDQSIRGYDLDGWATGVAMSIPADMDRGKIRGNRGFEALTFNAFTGLFWTTTEDVLVEDADSPGLLRLQSFGTDLKPAGRFLYKMDAPIVNAEEAAGAEAEAYLFGVPAMAALDDGRIIVLEREVYVPKGSLWEKARKSFTKTNLYVVNPMRDLKGVGLSRGNISDVDLTGEGVTGVLRKSLVCSFNTKPLAGKFANYEGMCLGPLLPDGYRSLVLISDSQHGAGGLVKEFVKVIVFK